AADGESTGPLVRDLLAAYEARRHGQRPDLAPLAVGFADFALWQQRVLGDTDDPGSVLGRQMAHWVRTLDGLPDLLTLPTDHVRPPVASMRGANIRFTIPSDTRRGIIDLARGLGATEFMVLHAGLAVLLARLSGTSDVAIGTPVAGR
ncbi:hypothetical protein G3I15_56030, partial [Streptomyces sp. SID10244]|nr:hypothetical protein [Streptomyces sp. SID10244]